MATLTNWILSQNADYVYPIAVNLFVSLLPAWMAFKVGGARRRTGLKYPLEYHPGVIDEKTDNDKYLFNCTQRASQNFMEGFPSFLIAMNACAITYPRFSAAAGLVWSVGRIWYQVGYSKYGPKGRSNGSHLAGLAQLALLGAAVYGLVNEFMAVA